MRQVLSESAIRIINFKRRKNHVLKNDRSTHRSIQQILKVFFREFLCWKTWTWSVILLFVESFVKVSNPKNHVKNEGVI